MIICKEQWADFHLLNESERDAFIDHAFSCEYHEKILTKYEESFLPILKGVFEESVLGIPVYDKQNVKAHKVGKPTKTYDPTLGLNRTKSDQPIVNGNKIAFLLSHATKSKIYIRRVEVSEQLLHSSIVIILISFSIAALFSIYGIKKPEVQAVNEPLAIDYSRSKNENFDAYNIGGPAAPYGLSHRSSIEEINAMGARRRQIKKTSNPDTLPTTWTYKGKINAEYGSRRNPDDKFSFELHGGIDIQGENGDPIVASAKGKVIRAGEFKNDDALKDYGNLIEIDHGNGLKTRYGHLSKIEVKIGTIIQQGQQIGLIGTTGRSTGPHIHFEILLDNKQINPRLFLPMQKSEMNGGELFLNLQLTEEEVEEAESDTIKDRINTIVSVSNPSFLPTMWAHLGKINNEFGLRLDPIFGRNFEFHSGMDIDGERGDSVFAPANGTVIKAGWQGGYGNLIEIDHGNGLTTRYGHLSKIEVQVGDTISRGQLIGMVGSTGRSTGPHLHYELRLNDKAINPRLLLPPEPTEIKQPNQ